MFRTRQEKKSNNVYSTRVEEVCYELFYMFGVRKRRCPLSTPPLSVVVARQKQKSKTFLFLFMERRKKWTRQNQITSPFNGFEGVVCVPRRGKEIKKRNPNNVSKKKGIKSFGMRGGEGNDESSAENSLIPFDELNMNPGNLVFLLVVLVRGGTPSSCMPSLDLYRYWGMESNGFIQMKKRATSCRFVSACEQFRDVGGDDK